MSSEAQAHVTLIRVPDRKPDLNEFSLPQKERILEIEVCRKETENTRMTLVIEAFKQENTLDHVSKSFLIYQKICEDKVMDETARQIFKDCIIKNVQSIKDDTKGASEPNNRALRDEIFAWYAAKAATATRAQQEDTAM
jgi:hypothetical protein